MAAYHPPTLKRDVEVIDALTNLSNHLLANPASRTLVKLKGRHPRLVAPPDLVARALHLLETQHYRLPARRFIMDLFDDPLTADSVGAILDAAKELADAAKLPPAVRMTPGAANGVTSASVRAKRHRSIRADFSDEEDDDSGGEDRPTTDEAAGPPKIAPGSEALVMRGFLL